MTDLVPLIPRQPVPALSVPLVGGGDWTLAGQTPAHFTLLNFYRGAHCPQCRNQLQELNRKAGDFAERGVGILALSCDPKDRAEQSKADWELGDIAIGYDLPLADARRWGLYISTGRGMTSIGIEEPALFSEPGVFLVRPDGTLYAAIVQTMPFVRMHFAPLIAALDTAIIAKDYPARGQVDDLGQAMADQSAG
ncbi:peroxiredoxin-like family protein [Bauldia litoralis]|uniref:peroxiredoxin-like family protein n=2 Tax=Bauldia litoralis TaxID=665467 RepID=UPI0032633583